MEKWEDYYKIVERSDSGTDPSSGHFEWNDTFQIVIIATNEVVGTYKNLKYARKQAKYKFKKFAKQVEKILLG